MTTRSKTPPARSSNRRPAWGMVAVLMAATLLLAADPANASWTERVRTIDSGSAGPSEPFDQFDAHPLKAYDINGDGEKEIIAHNNNKHVYVFDSSDGRILAELETTLPSGWGAARELNGPEVDVLVHGGKPHLVVANSAAYITLFRYDGSSGGSFHFGKVWETRLTGCGHDNPGMDGKPVVMDLNGDGRKEILGLPEEVGGFALRGDGSILWKNCGISGGNAAPVVHDLDGSGNKQVVWVSDNSDVTVTNAYDGGTQWVFHAKNHANLRSGSIPVSAAIGQIDGEGPLDIVFGARDSHDTENYDNNHAALFAVSGHGHLIWVRQHHAANPLTYTIPVIHDVDHDGVNDIIWGDWNTIGHKGGIPTEDSWQQTGRANFYRYDASGTLRWHQQLDTYWSNKDLPLADVDGDGVQEVLANGPGSGGDGIWYLDSRTGAKEHFVSVHPWKVTRAPIVEDLWGSGTMQWVVPVEAATNDVSGGALMIFDTHRGYNSAWPRAPDAGTHSTSGGGAPPSGGGSGDFDASFDTPGGNEWWVEVYVDANEPLAGVDARVNGQAWNALEKKSWGAWAKSMKAPDGSTVEFRARSTSGASETSGGYLWPSGEPTSGSGGGGGGSGDMTASFDTPGGNEWWVEVYVDASEPLAGVDARVNGQAWNALEKKDWGSWAKSMKAPDGSTVEFRARSTDGDQVVSQGYHWPSGEPTGSGGGGGGDFDASFDTPGGNEWWVEVYVDANEPLAGVDARVNGQAWNVLEKKDWGSWAKSMKAPDGSIVEFRAHSTDGDTDMSGKYRWPSGDPA